MHQSTKSLCAGVLCFITVLGLNAGSAMASTGLFQSSGDTYWFGQDGKRYLFPTQDDVLKSWSLDTTAKQTLETRELAAFPFGGIVRVRPGVKPVKVVSDNKIYFVARHSVLRPVNNPKLVANIYPTVTTNQMPTIGAAQFTNYAIGAPVVNETDFDPAKESEAIMTPDDNPPLMPTSTRPVAVEKTIQGNLSLIVTRIDNDPPTAEALFEKANSPAVSMTIVLVDQSNIPIKTCQFTNTCEQVLSGDQWANVKSVTAKAINELGQIIMTLPINL